MVRIQVNEQEIRARAGAVFASVRRRQGPGPAIPAAHGQLSPVGTALAESRQMVFAQQGELVGHEGSGYQIAGSPGHADSWLPVPVNFIVPHPGAPRA